MNRFAAFLVALLSVSFLAQRPVLAQGPELEAGALDAETLRHFQALLRFDTSDPPGVERPAAEYIRDVLEAEGIAVRMFATDENRPNVVARLRGSGTKPPLLIMGHTDTVNVDPDKWTYPPFSGTVVDGYVYSRGTVDDKDNVVAGLMVMLELARREVPLERDVIFLAESGEEGSTQYGIEFMVDNHLEEIEAEYCLAEGGSVTRVSGVVRYASVETVEKIPYRVELVSRGVAGHGSVPLKTNPVAHLSKAIAAIADWRSPIRLNETTSEYFRRLATISEPEAAARYLQVLDPETASDADEYFLEHEPRHASMLRSSLSPTIIDAGYRINVIPSDAGGSVDLRALPDEDIPTFLDEIRKVIDDPAVEVSLGQRNTRPPGEARLDTDAFHTIEANISKHYDTVTLPMMATGATDMAYLRARGIECYGIGPAIDREDAPKGFGAHSDQERILLDELHRFVRFMWDVVVDLASAD
ncbi:MAG TPA: M20/M25/M40 family metallo-hydrolase [Acidobacteriota bacterium]|nr:M20/M25/M40 family metallo-hydrolase [Acidobacteriota bacterium]